MTYTSSNRLWLFLGILALTACAGGGSFSINIEFPDGYKQLSASVRVGVIIPGDGASCAAFQDGSAVPGDENYPIEDELSISLPSEKGSHALKLGDPGPRLFFGEGYDSGGNIILRGCQAISASSSGPKEVTIVLEPVGPPCQQDDDCIDDDWCNGCVNEICVAGARDCSDGDVCTDDVCNETLDQCRHPVVQNPPTEGPVGDASCSDGADNDCDTLTDTDDPDCKSCQSNAECDDSETCTDDACTAGACVNTPVTDGTACDDGLYCSDPDVCTAGKCGGADRDCSLLADECTDADCDEISGACLTVPKQAGTTCSVDGIDCTDEQCDGAGNCNGTPNDGYCDNLSPGSVCAPVCTADSSGCVAPPVSLDLTCESPVDLGLKSVSDCSAALSGGENSGQAACLSCSAKAGVVTVERSGFDDGLGACDINGWALESGNNCQTNIADCTPGNPTRACCDVFADICDASGGDPVLLSDLNSNCSNDKQWKLSKSFDLSGLNDAWVCFDRAESTATTDSGLILFAEDGSNGPDVIKCLLGSVYGGQDGFFYRQCASLPAWANDNPAVTLTFLMQSNSAGETVYLDNIELKAWSGGCAADLISLLSDNLGDAGGCDTSNWTFSGGSHACLQTGCANYSAWQPGVVGEGSSFTMETVVDAGQVDGELVACFKIGSAATDAGDQITLEFDSGQGYKPAWTQAGSIGTENECREICVNLSDIDPAALRNPALGIRFDITSTQTIGLYGVTLSGAHYCSADPAFLSLSSPTESGGGVYDFTANDVLSHPLGATIQCRWNSLSGLEDMQSVSFVP
jgi:hypothetical protein